MAWYYNLNNQQTGPVEDAGIKDLIAAGTITRNTLVWQNGMDRWQPASATPLAAMLPQGPPPMMSAPPPAYAPVSMPQAAPAERVKQIKLFFMLWWILMAAGFVLCITVIGAILGIPAIIHGESISGTPAMTWSAVQWSEVLLVPTLMTTHFGFSPSSSP